MPNPKITLVTLDYPPQRGGVARYLSSLVDASRGAISVIDAKPLLRRGWPSWWPLVQTIRSLEQGTTVFVSHVFPVGTAAWISKMRGGPDYAVLFHGLDLRLARSLWKRWLLRHIVRHANVLFCNSASTRDDLKRLVPGVQATILTPGVEARAVPSREDARRRLDLDQNERIVVSLTRLVPRKGIDVALHAMGRIQHDRPVRYVVLGDGPDRDRLEKLASEYRTSVRWVLAPDDEETWTWLAAADLFLLPVRDEGDDVEGFGIVFLEAAFAGVPSVAGNSGGAPEAVRNGSTGFVVKPRSVDEVADAVCRLLDDDDLRHRLGAAARERALTEFRWEDRWKVVRQML